MKELPYCWYYTTRESIRTMKGFITMNSDTMKIDIDCLVRMIYGANDLLDSLNHADFQVKLRDALTEDKQKRREFLEANYGFLVGSIQTLSGAVQILADGLLNGDIDITYVPRYRGKEFDEWRRGSHEMIDEITDQKHMESIFHFIKGLKG